MSNVVLLNEIMLKLRMMAILIDEKMTEGLELNYSYVREKKYFNHLTDIHTKRHTHFQVQTDKQMHTPTHT